MPGDRVIDGRSILPYMKGQGPDKPIHDTFVVPGSTIRHGRWKLLVKGIKPGGKEAGWGTRTPAPAGALFDLQNDPGKTTDVSAKHPEVVADLERRMDGAMKEIEANKREIGRVPGEPGAPKSSRTKKSGRKK